MDGHVVPLNVQRYPFDVRPDGEKLGVFFDESSTLIGDEGESLFNENGEPSDYLNNQQKLLGDIANSEMATQKFIKEVTDLELLDTVQLAVQYVNGENRNVTGLHSINEKRLNALSDEKILELKKSGYLGAIYTVMLSLGQLNRLVQLSSTTDKPIRSIQLNLIEGKAEEPATEESQS